MSELLRPVLEQIMKLWIYVLGLPKFRWGTVTQSSPLRIRLDGDTVTITPQTVVKTIAVGRRVACIEQRRRVAIIAVVEI